MKILLNTILFFVLALSLHAQLTIQLSSIPANTPAGDNIYIAGNLNGWDAEHPSYVLTENNEGVLQIILAVDAGQLEFKFTRGGWETVEGTAAGGFIPNRTYQYDGSEQTIQLQIEGWEDIGGGGNGGSTAASNVSSFDFFIPQLNRNRRIWLYLPPDYETSNANYPVLYMQDGQNVFDVSTSFSGEWEVDESLNSLFDNGDDGIIVVAIDNGGANRINEYSPWVNPSYGGGEGDEYIDFIVETLKPYIDENYRTLSDRTNTGIMGSSLGGLISMYAAIEHQDVFSRAGIFSPSFWFTDECYAQVSNTGKEADMRIYLLAGEQESASMVPDLYAMYNTLLNAGFSQDELFITTHPDGQHSEWYWRREFPDAYEWLFADNVTSTTPPDFTTFQLSPNPTSNELYIEGLEEFTNPRIQIYAVDGQLILPSTFFQGGRINTSFLKEGTYIINIYAEENILLSKKLIIQR